MLVAQSYTHQIVPTDFSRPRKGTPIRHTEKELIGKRSDKQHGKPKLISAVTSPTSSKPVVIPTRTTDPNRRSKSPPISPQHDPSAISPSMAALLAVAAVSNKSSFSPRHDIHEKLLQKEKLNLDDFRFSLSSSSPKSWSILQSPVDEEDLLKEGDGDNYSIASASDVAVLSPGRSISLDSMPSLDIEVDSDSLTSLDLPTPASRIRTSLKKIVSPRSILENTDHPLSPPPAEPKDRALSLNEEDQLELHLSMTRVTPPKSLKSNLTASIRRLKSVAKTTLSTISLTQYTPNPLSSFSTPTSLSNAAAGPGQLVLHNIDALPLHLTSPLPDLPMSQTSIQLMSYIPSTVPSSGTATAPPVFLPATTPSNESLKRDLSPRPREPRENGDFLRIVVMEMNMRKAGKLNNEGRARIWLGARKDINLGHEDREQNNEQRPKTVPSRWEGISA